MIAPGDYHQTSGGKTIIGQLNGYKQHETLPLVAKQLRSTSSVLITDNLIGVMWTKLAVNCMLNPISAISGKSLGDLVKDKITRNLMLQTYSEVIDAANLLQIQLESIKVNPRLIHVTERTNKIKRLIKNNLLKFYGNQYRNVKSSMLQSLERNKKTEINFLNGYVVSKADILGLSTPLNRKLVEMVIQIENNNRLIKESNLKELF